MADYRTVRCYGLIRNTLKPIGVFLLTGLEWHLEIPAAAGQGQEPSCDCLSPCFPFAPWAKKAESALFMMQFIFHSIWAHWNVGGAKSLPTPQPHPPPSPPTRTAREVAAQECLLSPSLCHACAGHAGSLCKGVMVLLMPLSPLNGCACWAHD